MSDRDVDIQIAAGRTVERDDFVDITGQVAEEIRPETDGWFRVRFPNDVTAAQAEAIRRRTMASSNVEETLLERARTALAAHSADISANDAWLAANPGANAVLRELVRQSTLQARTLNALIRLVTRALDSTDGT